MRALVEELFEPSDSAHPDGSLGAELELIPVRSGNRHRVGIADRDGRAGTASVLRDAARVNGWKEQFDSYGAPSWMTRDGGRLSYEPGGQVEISSPVCASADVLSHFLDQVVHAVRESGKPAEVEFLADGVDPYNRIEDVDTELHAPRYDAMARHFNSIGPSGVRMMRQTASLQLNVELGPDPFARWTLLNTLAPFLIAAFANSRMYAGSDSGYASYRAHLWRTLDRSRTGIPFDASDPAGAYTRFAQRATRILDDDPSHLTTLFPEVRPRRYFELRSMDSMEPERAAQAIRFMDRLVHDSGVAAEARRVLGPPDEQLLERAAVSGRADSELNERLRILESLAR